MRKGTIYKSGLVEEVLSKQNLKAVYDMEFEIYEAEHRKQRFYIPVLSF